MRYRSLITGTVLALVLGLISGCTSLNKPELRPLSNFPDVERCEEGSELERKIPIGSWFHGGDMYKHRHNQQMPFEIYVIEEDNEESKVYQEKLTDEFIGKWVKQTNGYLDHLSNGQFQLDHRKTKRGTYDSLGIHKTAKFKETGTVEDMFKYVDPQGSPFGDCDSYKMVINSGFGMYVKGMYVGEGLFFVNHEYITLDNEETTYDRVAIHEIGHGLFGNGHSKSRKSIMIGSGSVIGLTGKEARYLDWPKVKPIEVKQSE